jgi:hypothetical protein
MWELRHHNDCRNDNRVHPKNGIGDKSKQDPTVIRTRDPAICNRML